MPLRKLDLRITDIVTSIERIMEYTKNLDFENFKSDTKTVLICPKKLLLDIRKSHGRICVT